jgi:hypothetical protein
VRPLEEVGPICWSCDCGALEDPHDEPGHITTDTLQKAAAAAGTDIVHVVGNIVLALSHFNPSLAKHAPGNLAAYRVLKSTNEQRFTLGVAYPAMKADVARAADGHRDFVSEEVLEKTAWEWLAKFRDVGLFHRDGTEGHFTPTESYIWRAPTWKVDSPVDGKPYLVCKGDWVLGGVWDDYGWTMVKSGLANGWSPEGGARRSTPTAERLALLRS